MKNKGFWVILAFLAYNICLGTFWWIFFTTFTRFIEHKKVGIVQVAISLRLNAKITGLYKEICIYEHCAWAYVGRPARRGPSVGWAGARRALGPRSAGRRAWDQRCLGTCNQRFSVRSAHAQRDDERGGTSVALVLSLASTLSSLH